MRVILYLQRWFRPLILTWLLAGFVFLLVASTASHYGITWDEPYYFHGSDLEIQWLSEFITGVVQLDFSALSDEKIKSAWHWNPYHLPHPPFSRILSGLTKAIFSPLIDKYVAYRLAPALFFALLVTVMYLWMTSLFGRAAGLFSAVTLILLPNLFAFAHIAVTDMPLTALWFITVYCFWRGLKDWRWSVALGVVWGLALSTKFPALLIPIPLILWAHLYHSKDYTNNIFSMCFLAPSLMIASQPYLWHRTFMRILEFLYEGISRGYRLETNYSIFFFNQVLPSSDLPWYYSFFMTGITVPETFLVLIFVGLIGLVRVRPKPQIIVLFLFNAVFILSLGILPGAVLHDVNRIMLPVLPFLAGLAGYGFFILVEWLAQRSECITALQNVKHLRSKLVTAVFVLVLFLPALDLLTYHPYELSYFNRLIGGIRGAYRRGLEVTYFMEAMTPDFLAYLNRELPPNAVVNASFSNFMLKYYQKENRLRKDIRITENDDYNFYILLNRQSAFTKKNRKLLDRTANLYGTVSLYGVPLVLVYRIYEEQN